MPNWVYNTLTVTADDPKVIAKIIDEVRPADGDEPISFQSIVPRPADKDDDWYDWNVTHWGTKWDACNDVTVDHDDDTSVSYVFDTAWSPPLPVVEQLSRRYPNTEVELSYEEEQGWGGVIWLRDGKTLSEESWDIPTSHKDLTDRGRDCHCDDDDQRFDDCFYWRAVEAEQAGEIQISTTALALIEGLAAQWQGNLASIIETARALEADPARARP